MNRLILTLAALFFYIHCNGQPNCDYKVDTAKLLKNQNEGFINKVKGQSFVYSQDKAKIPNHVWQVLRCFNPDFLLANPEEEWQDTDMVYDETLPRRKLTFLATNGNFVIISYLHGGVGLHQHVVLMEFLNNKLIDFLPCTGFPVNKPFATMMDVFPFIRDSKFEDEIFWIEI